MPEEILKEVKSLGSLEQAMNWAFARTPPARLVDVVTQDEFTHDIVIRVDEGVFLNFDTT
jgi:hypothetical protein